MRTTLIVLALVGALLAGLGTPAATSANGSAMETNAAKKAKKKKRKAIKCKKNQVPIKVNRRVVGCRSLGAALPPPREGDERLALAASVLDDDLRGLRDRRGRQAPSVKKLFRKVGPRAHRAMQAAIPQGLTRLDALATPAPQRVGPARFGRVLPNCPGAPPPTKTDSYSSSSGGEKVAVTMTAGAVGTLGLQMEGGGYTIKASITSDACSHFDAPSCPTAAGIVEATDRSTFKVSLSIAKGGETLLSQSFDYGGQTTMRAEVGDDAKLRFFDIDDTQTANIELGGRQTEYGPIQFLYTGIHHARVNMPGGGYEPGQSAVDIAVTAKGVTTGTSALGDAGLSTAKDLDDKFATLVKKEVDNFKAREKGWSDPATKCAEITFNPGSGKDKLAKGARGSFTAQAVAAQDRGPVQGRWELGRTENANVSPAQADGGAPQFSYEVTNAGKDVVAKVTLKITSKAGVGQGTWQQETEDKPLYMAELTATMETPSIGCDSGYQWTYHGRLASWEGADRGFAILEGGAVPGESGAARAYQESVIGTLGYPACHGRPGCSAPLGMENNVSLEFHAEGDIVTVDGSGIYLQSDCGLVGAPLQSLDGFPRSMIGAETITVDFSYSAGDGLDSTLTLHRVN